MHHAVFYVLRSIFGGSILIIERNTQYSLWSILFILSTTQYFRRVNTIYTKYYAVFSEGGQYLYYELRNIFVELILFILCTTLYFRGVDTIYTMHNAVFSGGGYCLYYAVFLEGGYYLYYELRIILVGRILFILCTTQYFWGADTV